jgi:hypothetical protein
MLTFVSMVHGDFQGKSKKRSLASVSLYDLTQPQTKHCYRKLLALPFLKKDSVLSVPSVV